MTFGAACFIKMNISSVQENYSYQPTREYTLQFII